MALVPLVAAVVLPPQRRTEKLVAAAAFQTIEGVLLSSLGYAGAAILYPAALVTSGACIGLAAVAAAAPPRYYISLATPIASGCAALMCANVAGMLTNSAGWVPRQGVLMAYAGRHRVCVCVCVCAVSRFAAALLDIRLGLGLLVTTGYIVFDCLKLVDDAMHV